MLVSTSRSGTEGQQQVAVLGLGHINPSCHGLVCIEAAALVEDYADRTAQRVRPPPHSVTRLTGTSWAATLAGEMPFGCK
jgi:hypothetical protein